MHNGPVSISQLSINTTVTGSNLIPVYVSDQGDTRRMSITDLQAYLQENLTFTDSASQQSFITQYSAPSTTGFSVEITNGVVGDVQDDNVHLILTPSATFAAGTIVLPADPGVVDRQEVLVNCTQIVTALTIDGNGASAVVGAPTSLSANSFFRLKYDIVLKTWYRVG